MRSILICGLMAVTAAASAEIFNVAIQDMAFVGGDLTIATGDTVVWTNLDPFQHTVTEDTFLFSSDPLNQNDTFSFTFTNAGVFGYHCEFHPRMMGTIEVVPEPTSILAIATGGILLALRRRR